VTTCGSADVSEPHEGGSARIDDLFNYVINTAMTSVLGVFTDEAEAKKYNATTNNAQNFPARQGELIFG